jgi:hypothetical protein
LLKIEKLLGEMSTHNIKPDSITFSRLLKFASVHGSHHLLPLFDLITKTGKMNKNSGKEKAEKEIHIHFNKCIIDIFVSVFLLNRRCYG